MKNFDYITNPAKLLTPEIVQMVGSIHEHKGKQELFLEANIDELKTLLEVALIQSTGASNRIEGIFTSDKRLEELVSQKATPRAYLQGFSAFFIFNSSRYLCGFMTVIRSDNTRLQGAMSAKKY